MTIAREQILGVILAGGQARRMGGGDKGRLSFGPRSLIAEVIARLRPQVGALVLNANGAPGRFADLGLEVVADDVPGQPGPLAGVLAGMEAAAARGMSHVLSAPADTPFLPPDLAVRLAQAPGPVAMVLADGRRQPVCALWPAALRHDLRQALAEGVTKVGLWAGAQGVVEVSFPAAAFFNVNTPADLAEARRIGEG